MNSNSNSNSNLIKINIKVVPKKEEGEKLRVTLFGENGIRYKTSINRQAKLDRYILVDNENGTTDVMLPGFCLELTGKNELGTMNGKNHPYIELSPKSRSELINQYFIYPSFDKTLDFCVDNKVSTNKNIDDAILFD